MKHTYIENFKKKKINGVEYNLDFFIYVVGTSAGGLDNFKEIILDTGVRGSVIYAHDLFKTYNAVKVGNTTPIKVWNLFKSNRHVTSADLK